MYEKLFEINNKPYKDRIYMNRHRLIYKPTRFNINHIELNKMIAFANYVNSPNWRVLDVVFDLSKRTFCDKLSYVLLEYICKYIQNDKRNVYIKMSGKTNIYVAGIRYSPLMYLMSTDKNIRSKFYSSFGKHIDKLHYRKVAHIQDNSIYELPSLLMTDVRSFLSHLGIDSKSSAETATVISELVDNAIDHGENDVLVDIDVADNYRKHGDTKPYCGVNIVILNFSDILLKTKVQKK